MKNRLRELQFWCRHHIQIPNGQRVIHRLKTENNLRLARLSNHGINIYVLKILSTSNEYDLQSDYDHGLTILIYESQKLVC
jgi:hypothetical protein